MYSVVSVDIYFLVLVGEDAGKADLDVEAGKALLRLLKIIS